jgi:O-antigen/teichoic acid export membrane protein
MGYIFALFNFSMILNIFLDLGITNFNNRNISQHRFLLHKHLSNIVGLKLMLAIVYAVFSLVVAAIIGYNKIQFHLLFFLIINQFLVSFTLYLRSNISALHLFRTDSLISVLDRTLMIIICSVLLFTNIAGGKFQIEWFVYSQTIAYVITLLITMLVVISKSGKITIRVDRKFALVFLRKSYPYALLILLMAFYNRIDSVMLERMLPDPIGKREAGVYAQAFRLLDAVAMFGALVGGLLLPMFSSMIKKKEPVGPIVNLAVALLFVPSIIIAVSSLLYDRDIMALLYHSHIEDSADMLGLLMTGFVGIATTYIFGSLLTANGSIKELNYMAAGGMILNVVLNLILIPRYYALGSAVASMVTQISTAVIQVVIAAYVFKLRPRPVFLFKMITFISVVVVLGILSRYIDNRAIGYIGMIGASMIFAFLTGLINLKNLYQIIAYKQ